MLHWRAITHHWEDRFLTKGTELSFAIVPGTMHRFGISEVRTFTRVGDDVEYDREYCIRDAAAVTDAEVRAGKRPPIVARFSCPDEAAAYCTLAMLDDYEEDRL